MPFSPPEANSSEEDLYDLLGAERSAQLPELRKAYRQKCVRTHPDKGGDRRSFENVAKAFEILSDADLRRAYDELGRLGAESLRQGKQTVLGSLESILGLLESSRVVAQRPELWRSCLSAIEEVSQCDEDAKAWFLHTNVLGRLSALFKRLPSLGWELQDETDVVRSFVRCMSQLCRGQPVPPATQLDKVWDCLVQVLSARFDDGELSVWALEGLHGILKLALEEEDDSEEEESHHAARLACREPAHAQPPLPELLVERLASERSEAEVQASLELLSALLATPAPEPTDSALDAGAATALRRLLEEAELTMSQKAARAIASAAAHVSGRQACRLLEEPGLWGALCHAAETGGTWRYREDCLRAVVSFAKHGHTTLRLLDCPELLRLAAASLSDSPAGSVLWGLLDTLEACLLPSGDAPAGLPGCLQAAQQCGLQAALEKLRAGLPPAGQVCLKAERLVRACQGPAPRNGGA